MSKGYFSSSRADKEVIVDPWDRSPKPFDDLCAVVTGLTADFQALLSFAFPRLCAFLIIPLQTPPASLSLTVVATTQRERAPCSLCYVVRGLCAGDFAFVDFGLS